MIFDFNLNRKELYKFPYLMSITIYVNFVIKKIFLQKLKDLKKFYMSFLFECILQSLEIAFKIFTYDILILQYNRVSIAQSQNKCHVSHQIQNKLIKINGTYQCL